MQNTPALSSADVARIIKRDFDADDVETALAFVGEYGVDDDHEEAIRVQLAALKVSAGGLDLLRSTIDRAKIDFRDILMEAEYPEQARQHAAPGVLAPKARRRIVEADRRQYADWLNGTTDADA